jgi:hypothetical protein
VAKDREKTKLIFAVTPCGKRKSGRADSNRRRPAWEADILPLNYARKNFY